MVAKLTLEIDGFVIKKLQKCALAVLEYTQ